jgi:hypothetical protein
MLGGAIERHKVGGSSPMGSDPDPPRATALRRRSGML